MKIFNYTMPCTLLHSQTSEWVMLLTLAVLGTSTVSKKNWIPGADTNIQWSPQHQNSCGDLICTNFQWIPPNHLHSIAPNTCPIESLHCLFPSISLVQPDPVQVCIFQVLQLSWSTAMQGWHATCDSVCLSSMRSPVPCKSVQSIAENLRARSVLLQECKSYYFQM